MDIFERAKRLGVDTEYRDGFGHPRTVEPEVLVRILDALAAGGNGAERMLPRTILVRENTEQPLRLAAAEGQPLTGSFMDYLLPTASEVPAIESRIAGA